MKKMGLKILAGMALLLQVGCASYSFRSSVPEEMRTLAVPVFENSSGFPELDASVTQAILREVQREGTFTISTMADASLVLHGKLVKSKAHPISHDRNYSTRTSEYRYRLAVEFSLWERESGKMLIRDRTVEVDTTFATRGDMLTGLRDAYPRLSKEVARSVVDLVLAHWAAPAPAEKK